MALKNTIEALLFAAGKGMSLNDIYNAFQFQNTMDEVKQALGELKNEYSDDRGIIIIEYDGKYQFQSNPEYGELLADTLMETKEKALSMSLMETLAIVAYNQPLTKLNIEQIRGKNPDYAISVLLTHNLIKRVGVKDVVGRPNLYGTTDEFLRKFRLKRLTDLPDYDELLNAIRNNIDKYYVKTEGLYKTQTLEEERLAENDAKNAESVDRDEELVFEDEDNDDMEFDDDAETIE